MTRDRKIILVSVVAVIVVIIAIACVLLRPQKFSQDTKAIAEAEESVVKVFCYNHLGEEIATGSGFVMFEDDVIITNYHVVKDVFSIKISTNQDITYSVVGLLAVNKDQDIAVLKTDKKTNLSPLVSGDSLGIKKGETVTAIGSPMGIKNTVSIGNLSGRLMNGSYDTLQFTAPISHGSSGGALFNEKGQVVGITYASIVDSQNLNLAIPIELVVSLYDENKHNTEISLISDEYWLNHVEEYFIYTYGTPQKVSFDQLKNNPIAYENKMIVLETYVSSVRSYGDAITFGIYVGKKDYITNSYDDDSLEKNSNKHIFVYTYKSNNDPLTLGVRNIKFESGDKILLTGVFKKHVETEGYFIEVKSVDFVS